MAPPSRLKRPYPTYEVPVELECNITPQVSKALLVSFVRYILFSRSQTFTTVDQLERHHEVCTISAISPRALAWVP